MSTNTEASILSRLIEPEKSNLPPEAAHYMLSLDFRKPDKERMGELCAKANEGTLTQEERAELENYNQVSHLLALLQSKARQSLKKRTG